MTTGVLNSIGSTNPPAYVNSSAIPASNYGDKIPSSNVLANTSTLVNAFFVQYVDAWTQFSQNTTVSGGVNNAYGSYFAWDNTGTTTNYFYSTSGGVATLYYSFYVERLNSYGLAFGNVTDADPLGSRTKHDPKYSAFLLSIGKCITVPNLTKLESYFSKLSLFDQPNKSDMLALFDNDNNNNADTATSESGCNNTPIDDVISVVDDECACNKLSCLFCVSKNQNQLLKQLHARIVL